MYISSWIWNALCLCVFLGLCDVSSAQGEDDDDDDTDDISNESVFRRTDEQIASKSKVDTLGPVLKRHIQALRRVSNKKVDIVFLVDSSASVGPRDFEYEIKFVRKLLADFTVDSNHTRVCVITFSSKKRVLRQIDYVGRPLEDKNKCTLLEEDVPKIKYVGGGTFTLGAFLEAKEVLSTSRRDSEKAIFLVTDGFSNGGDPRPEAKYLRDNGVKIFTFGIRNGNVRELLDMASDPKNETSYILDSFEEFEALARRALHEDLGTGSYVAQNTDKCQQLCINRSPCCDKMATCQCGTHTGNFECVCRKGYYGTGLHGECYPCPSGTYKDEPKLGDKSTCKKCPDENQHTEPGASHVSQCSCKKGFSTVSGTRCSVLRCPELRRPDHGYFVNDHCDSVYNAACGMKCKPGYELRGNSLRICQENGRWSGEEAECVMKTCPPLPTPKHGNMICDRDDFSFSTVCRFTCDTGYKLVGSRKRECLAIAFWTGIPTRCKEITCQPLPQVRDGVVKPLICTAKEVSFGTICQVECLSGYSLVGPERKQCTPEGMWAPESYGEMSRCEDKSPPFLLCPADIQVEAPDDDNAVEVNWQVPLALDNSGLIPIMTVVPAVEPPKRFPIGLTYVKYIAEDLSGNREKCKFSVVIKDITPPRVDSCFSPSPFVSSTPFANVIWDEPQFSDNSGETPRVEKTHAPGLFPRGLTFVIYTAFDESGNNSTCKLEIQVIPHPCQYPPMPVNGQRHCHETTEGVYCNVTCDEGFAFAIPPADVYFCAYDNVWTPEENMPIPDCSVQTVTNSIELPASITYIASVPCRDHLILNEIQKDFHITLSGIINGLCAENMICEVDDMETTCEEEAEDFNRIKIILGRKRRDIVRIVSKDSGEDVGGSANPADSSITFDFVIRGQYESRTKQPPAQQTEKATEQLKGILTVVKTEGSGGALDIRVGDSKAKFANLTVSKTGPRYKCKEGGVLVNTSCVKCPVGTFFNVVTKSCSGCPLGTYQPLEGSVACLVCPVNHTTDHNNSKSEQECKAQCLPGTFSADGLERCSTCEIGFYQQEYGQTKCVKCPRGTTTKQRGARGLNKCEEPCEPGYVSSSGLKPCFPCPKGSYQSDFAQTACFECPGKTLTTLTASTDVTDCNGFQTVLDNQLQMDEPDVVVYNDCFESKCQNGATCRKRLIGFICVCPPGYKGIYCETRMDHCEGAPCLNGGSCNNHLTNYTCSCSPGFMGNKCEVNIDDCASTPCENNGTCQDLANDFACSCPEFFKGPTCNETVDFCTPSPCLNNGDCHRKLGGYNCTCPVGFRGTNCEINHDDCNSGPCLNGGSCEDGIANFRCQCLLGFSGDRCQVDINDCSPDPCVNATRCEDLINGYTCHCQKGFTGERCDKELEVQYLLDFPFAGTFNYTSTTIDQDMTSVTASFWMKTDDVVNQGTPFSYASSDDMDNALTLTSYDGFVVYVNNEQKTTDVKANDGRWHHIVFTWSSNRGVWKIYIDGVAYDTGYGLADGQVIKGGGKFVIGQEQDRGGTYNSAESFVGQITHLNVWDRELSFNEIEAMRISCEKFVGDVIAWPDIQMGLHGSLTPEPSNFCQGCPVPVKPTYGQAEFSSTEPGATVKYSCLRGFEFRERNIRQCLITGEWSGAEFECLRVRCGYPNRIDNGFIEGRKYEYESTIRYRCENNYRLQGPERRYCNENGTWEGDSPTCEEITCTLPLLSENTIPSSSKQHYRSGEAVIFSCKEGYKLLTDHDFVSCQKDGTWDRSVPTCDPQTCKHVPSVNHAVSSASQAEYSVGFILTFTCDPGYRLSGTNPTGRITCLPNGQWENNTPQCEIVTCPNPPSVINAVMDVGGMTYLSPVTYQCTPGYEMYGGTDVIECIEDGTWDPLPPECQPVECGDPGLIENGVVTALSYTYNSVASYRCNVGYVLNGNSTRKCQSNKEWSGAAPTCAPISCGQPESIENGVFEQNGNVFESIATYGCLPGYDLQGEAARRCEANGAWSGSPPGCTKVECGAPPLVSHGVQTSTGVYFQDTVTYSCEIGFRSHGDSTLRCGATGNWEPLPPTCEAITCPTPEIIRNGNFTLTGSVFGARVEYFCLPGYKLKSESIRVCQPDGTWSSNSPSCVADECPVPLPVENGKFNFKDRSLGSVVVYTCNPGYNLIGSTYRRCENTLSWSGSEPICAPKSCAEPDEILNGNKNVSGLLYNSVVTYECDVGFILRGSSQRTCTSSGAWSGTAPGCDQIVCDTPSEVISNGRSYGNSSTYDSVVIYECDPGYNLNGASRRQCLESGQWDFEIPVCEVVHCPRPHLPNGIFSGFKTEFTSTVTFQCRSGYVLFGSSERTCLESGFWSGSNPVCVRWKEIPSIEYASVLSNGNRVTYFCDNGYKLVGNSILQFQSDGEWHGDTPRCVQIVCDIRGLDINNFINGNVVYTNISVNDSALYQCNQGYNLLGNSKRTCMPDGSWSGTRPFCNIVFCSGNFNLDNGQISGTANHYTSSLEFTCTPGFRLIGDERITCLENGSWSGSSPRCERINCPLPNGTGAITVSFNSLSVGSTVQYMCPDTYEIVGDSLRTCLETGNWSGVEPTCREIQCPVPSISNGQINMRSNTIGSFVTYSCDEGYTLMGTSWRFCTNNATWTNVDPTCEIIKCPPPRSIAKGTILDNGRTEFFYGDMVRYRCIEGHLVVSGDTDHVCQGAGTWSGRLPVCVSVACGPLPTLENTITNLLNGTLSFNSVVEYTCEEGYRSQGSQKHLRTCQANGSWSAVSITCAKVECPMFPAISNGSIIGNSVTFGSNISVICDEGYRIVGESHFRCLANGSWSIQRLPSCQRIVCPIPELFVNGHVQFGDMFVGESIEYSCNTGYELLGDEHRMCTSSGHWNGSTPFCRKIVCRDPPVYTHAVISSNTTEYTSFAGVTYECLPGYTMMAKGSIHCNDKGYWEGSEPTCHKILCEKPRFIANGDVRYDNISYGSSVTFSCQNGYILSGSRVLTCLETGLWNGSTPSCNPVNCGSPTSPENGFIVGDIHTYGNTIAYICDEGYELSSEGNLICREDGTWSRAPPQCNKVNCGLPPTVPNARIRGSDFLFQGVVTYACDVGYKLRGNANIICGSNSEWSISVPRCEIISCGTPKEIVHATVKFSAQTYNSIATYTCNYGYTIIGDRIVVCTENETWSLGGHFDCAPVDCGIPPSVSNATTKFTSTTFLSSVVYQCQTGYSLRGNDRIQCEGNGMWQTPLPVCTLNDCPAPDIPPGVIFVSGTYRVGDSLIFRCPLGYFMMGGSRITCAAAGVWNSSVPNCQKMTCPPLRLPESLLVNVIKAEYVYEDRITFRCEDGRTLVGHSQLQCQSDGTWSDSLPYCSPHDSVHGDNATVVCQRHPGTQNTRDFRQQFPVGNTRNASCKPGYEMAGSLEVTCLSSGKWSTPSGYCRKLYCGKPPITDMINIIRVQGRSYFYRDEIRYQCRAGIQPIRSPPIITCTETGQWDGKIGCHLPCKGGCKNGGVCLGYYGCKCPAGYGGNRCERAFCLLPCLHRGRCVAPYLCACPNDYTGSRCQTPVCNPPCQNNGICEKPNVCHCQHGYQGHYCEKSDLRTFESAARARQTTTSRTTVTEGWSWQ